MIRQPPRSTRVRSSAASDVYKRQGHHRAQDLPHRGPGVETVGDARGETDRRGWARRGARRPAGPASVLGAAVSETLLTVDAVDAAYGSASVLHNVSVRVDPGEMVFIAGRNGAGKTTLLKTIAGFMPPVDG